MKINEILAEARPVKLTGTTTSTQSGSALGSFLRGAGATQGAAAADAYANANALAPGVRQTKIRKPKYIRASDLVPNVPTRTPQKPEIAPTIINKPWTITLPSGTVSRDAQGVWKNDNTGEVINQTNDIKKLNYYADLGVTDPEAQKAIDAQKSADMMARLRAREKQAYQPVDVSQKTQEPIKIGKEVIKPGDPRYAKLAARLK